MVKRAHLSDFYLDYKTDHIRNRQSLLNETKHIKFWDYIKNNDLDLKSLKAGSVKNVYWSCKFNHTWTSPICNYTRSKSPYCKNCYSSNNLEEYNSAIKDKYGVTKIWIIENYIESENSLDDLWRIFGIGHIVIRRFLKMNNLTKNFQNIIKYKNSKRDNTNLERYGSNNPHSFSGRSSKYEKEIWFILNMILMNNFKIINNDSKEIYPKELDIYVPSLNFAIEFNGNYWHDKDSWLNDLILNEYNTSENIKTLLCSNKGIKLLHIWEDDWNNLQSFINKYKILQKFLIEYNYGILQIEN